MTISLADTDAAIAACHPVLVQLRPHLTVETLVAQVRAQQREGYRLAYRHDAAGRVYSCAGYRMLQFLAWGRVLYVDDLVTAADARSGGHGRALLDWLRAEGRRAGCDQLHLDSGTHRHDAHRFYFRERMQISSFHFSRPLR